MFSDGNIALDIGDVEDETLQMRILTAFNLDKVASPPPSPLHFELVEHF